MFASLQNDFGKTIAIGLGLLAVVLGAYAIISVLAKDDKGLDSMLEPYSGNYASSDELGDPAEQGMAQTAVMQRAVELTRQFAEQRGFLDRVESALERANLPLRAPEAMLFYGAGAVVVSILSLLLTRNVLIFLVVAAIAALLPPAAINFMANKRRRQFEALLPDTLQLLAGTMRAGYSLMQGVEAVSQEVDEPMGRELRRVVTESRLGRPLEESLDAVAERMDSKDFAWAVMAIRIQREVGGNLSELLMTVAETMTMRERLRREVNTLTAEGRISCYVLGVLPFALGLAMQVINPDYMTVMFEETIGRVMLGGGFLMMIGGFFWMQSIVKIDV
jgi:tight adherence protein B